MKKDNIQKFINDSNISDEEFEIVCEYIKLRYESNMSQRELAEKTKLAQSTIARLEKNMHSASLSTFIKLLNAIGCKLVIKRLDK